MFLRNRLHFFELPLNQYLEVLSLHGLFYRYLIKMVSLLFKSRTSPFLAGAYKEPKPDKNVVLCFQESNLVLFSVGTHSQNLIKMLFSILKSRTCALFSVGTFSRHLLQFVNSLPDLPYPGLSLTALWRSLVSLSQT